MFMLGKPSTMPDSVLASVITSTDCSNPGVFVHVGLSTETSVGEFSMVPNNWVLSVIWLWDKGLVITILTCNLTSTPQGLGIAKDALITFCFTRVSFDIQIRQLINDIKCALADCVPLSRSATVINIRILLKATSYFSPSLHYVWIFTSRIFLNKKIKWTTEFIIVWTWNYDYDNTHRPFCRYLITNFIKQLVIKTFEMILRFYTYVIPPF